MNNMRNNTLLKQALLTLLIYLALSLASLLMLIPFLWMVTTSLKDHAAVFLFPPQWLPDPIRWENYALVFENIQFLLHFFNSLYIAVLVTLGTCLLASLAGYAFAKIDFPFKNTIFLLLLSSIMIPTEVTIIPLFNWIAYLGLANTHFPLIIPPILGAGGILGTFVLRQFFMAVPDELIEAARIDGCTPWTTFWLIMLPQTWPAVTALAIIVFLQSWNDFFDPLIYLSSKDLYTLPLALALFMEQSGTEWHLIMAASVMVTLPLLLIFFIAQRRFTEGVTITGLK